MLVADVHKRVNPFPNIPNVTILEHKSFYEWNRWPFGVELCSSKCFLMTSSKVKTFKSEKWNLSWWSPNCRIRAKTKFFTHHLSILRSLVQCEKSTCCFSRPPRQNHASFLSPGICSPFTKQNTFSRLNGQRSCDEEPSCFSSCSLNVSAYSTMRCKTAEQNGRKSNLRQITCRIHC